MRLSDDGKLRLSPSDVNNFLACQHLPALDILRAEGKASPDKGPRPDAELVAERGLQHERAFREKLRAEGHDVVVIPEEGLSTSERAALTEKAMRGGAEVIHQAGFQHQGWRGYADFVIRVDEPSELGEFSYEAHDAKLAAHPKPYFIFQLVFYTEQIGRLQGRLPERMHLILGTNERPSFRTTDFTAYTTRVGERYLAYLDELSSGGEPPYPYPVEHCNWCEWWAHCKDRRRADDHLSLVAFLGRGQAVKLEDAGVFTVADLAVLPDETTVDRLAARTLAGLRQQARLQVEARESGENVRELFEPEYGRGFARLPDASPGDVFFDIEGDPYWGEDGLEYLFGTVTDDGNYSELWAHDRPGERRMFEEWMDEMTERLAKYPDMHIYHYNSYEPTAVKKLMQRYGTREHEVDELLRRAVFVDLYAVLRQAMRIGKESYSLKSVEDFYGFERDAEVTEAGGSMLAYQEWMDAPSDDKLRSIADYNADDCGSTLGLREWLLGERSEAERQYGLEIAALEPPEAREVSEEKQALIDELAALSVRLTANLPDEEDPELEGDDRARRLLADVLEYHYREAKPQWWAYYERMTKTPDELRREDAEAIGGLHLAEEIPLGESKQSWLYPLRFEAQEHKIGPGPAVDPTTECGVNVWEVDDVAGLVWIKRGKKSHEKPLPDAIGPGMPIPQAAQQARLRELAKRVCERGTDSAGELDAACDLLTARAPRADGISAGEALIAGHPDADSLAQLVAALEASVLFVQGPPGSGKTWAAARAILRLIDSGLRVGVMSTAHKAIAKLLDDIEEATAEIPVDFRGLKKSSGDYPDSHYEGDHIESSTENRDFPGDPGEHQLLAGTAWLWAREEMRESVDVLFVDEAGQVALADALAVSHAAKSVVLLGDPQQLAHVSQGAHPRGSGGSVLQHLLGEEETVPPDRGVFLDLTYRMHPDVCRVVSEAMYEGRLHSAPGRERQSVDSPGLTGTGPRMLHVEHADNRQRAPEEAERIATEVELLLNGGTFTDGDGAVHDLTLDDILIVAPYNAQVRCLRDHLPEGARVGTVDKFQGQQAPAVFFSMTSSSGEDVPRGMDFLFSRNRLNVAVSRAQAISIVVCSPQLLWARCNSVEQMRLVNALCRFADAAASISPADERLATATGTDSR